MSPNKDNTANTEPPHKAFTSEPSCRHLRTHPEASCEQTLLRQLPDKSTSRSGCRLKRLCETSTYTEGSAMDTPRSYTIQTPNSNIRRNRVHITPTVKQSPPPTQTTPPPLILEPPPDNDNLSIGPQVKDTVANDHPPAQTLPPQHTGTERLSNNGPANLATLASPDKPPEPLLGHTRTRTRTIKPPLRFKYYELT